MGLLRERGVQVERQLGARPYGRYVLEKTRKAKAAMDGAAWL